MSGELDKNPPVATEPAASGNKSDSGTESDDLAFSSSTTMATIKMADNMIPEISDY
jgi:hypothetical protein